MFKLPRKSLHRLLVGVFLLLLALPATILAQEREFSVNGFRGLEIDKSTSEDVKKLLGKPDRIKEKSTFETPGIDKWLDSSLLSRSLQKLTYNKVWPYRTINFLFKENKLVVVDVAFHFPDTSFHTPWQHWTCDLTLIPDDLEAFFGAKFKPFNGSHFPATPAEFERYTPKPFKKANYLIQFYGMVSITEKTFVSVGIDSTVDIDPSPRCSFFNREKAGLAVRDMKIFPGEIIDFQIISRSLEKN
jgi:hypothetical protein